MNFPNPRTRTSRSLLPLLTLSATLLLISGCGKEQKTEAARAPVEVTALTVTPRDVPIASVFVAQTQSSQAVTIAARVSGFLDKRVYTEGAVVKAGQVLFRMDPKPFQAQVDGAAAALQRNEAALEVARANLARTRPLAQQNALSQKDLDDAQGQYEQGAAAVAQSKAQLESAQLDLSYTTIASPVDGVSSFAAVADGTYVNAQIGAAKALYFPTISLTGAFGSSSSDLSNLFTGPTRVWSYAGQVVGPIFTFGAVSGQVAQSEAAQQAALLNYQLSIQSAFADVDNALVASQKLKEQLAAQERLVAALRDYARLAKLQYDGGYAPDSTVLQAEQALLPSELTLAAVRTAVFTSAANTYKAMGGGWITEADRLTGSAGIATEGLGTRAPVF